MALLLVDLDGTLIDSVEGISNCVRHALGALGTPVPDEATLRSWIGPPLRNSFARIFDDPRHVEQAISLYRERFDELGWREHQVYAGVGEALGALRDAGHRLAVCTAKIERHAERIVAHLPFAQLFERITGMAMKAKPATIGGFAQSIHDFQGLREFLTARLPKSKH